MKKILLLGDSIRINYQEYVKKTLENEALVCCPNDNGRFGYFMLRYIDEWIRVFTRDDGVKFDIIHFNVGLWDVLRLSSEDRTFTSEQEYEDVLRRIIRRLRQQSPQSVLIFALTTEVIEPGYEKGSEYAERRNEDICRFNVIASRVMRELGIDIDDLYSVSQEIREVGHSDSVHFDTEIGKRELGEKVIKSLRPYL